MARRSLCCCTWWRTNSSRRKIWKKFGAQPRAEESAHEHHTCLGESAVVGLAGFTTDSRGGVGLTPLGSRSRQVNLLARGARDRLTLAHRGAMASAAAGGSSEYIDHRYSGPARSSRSRAIATCAYLQSQFA